MPRPSVAKSSHAEPEFDLLFPPLPALSPAVFAAVGEAALRDLVHRHHDRLRRSSIGDLFPSDPKRFAVVVEHIATFMVETTRGSSQYVDTHGPVWFRTRHLPLTIDETARNVWLAALLATFEEVAFPEPARQEFWNWVEALSIRAITRRTMVGQPRRYALTEAPTALRAFMPK